MPSAPYRSNSARYASWRRADSTSRSMSGRPSRLSARNRSISRSCRSGSRSPMPIRWLTRLPAPEPRIAQRMPRERISAAASATVRK
ncbi:hypothetical protein BJF79_38185 [Actinomadura sp. CNU-125]|nr:hypothetical protein BJF79_38185 [Actinomadura sp. CNU-125]